MADDLTDMGDRNPFRVLCILLILETIKCIIEAVTRPMNKLEP